MDRGVRALEPAGFKNDVGPARIWPGGDVVAKPGVERNAFKSRAAGLGVGAGKEHQAVDDLCRCRVLDRTTPRTRRYSSGDRSWRNARST